MAGGVVVGETDWFEDRWFVRSHLLLRRLVGAVGFALPIVLVGFGYLWPQVVDAVEGTRQAPDLWASVRSSLSDYYYSPAGNIFVGAMIAFAVFLVTYRYGRWERRVGTVSGLAAAVVGLFPTTPVDPTALQRAVGGVHLAAAGVFFAGMAVFCLFLFPRDPAAARTGAPNTVPPGRRALFVLCGVVITLALVVAVVGVVVLDDATQEATRFLLWPESVAVFAFATAWAVKGRELAEGS